MKDAVLHESNRFALFGLEVNPSLISAYIVTAILLIAAVVSAVVSYIQVENDYIDSIIIVAIVVFNAIMGLVQEAKAEKSLEALKDMSAPVAKVRRDGRIVTVKGTEVVPGDIVLLEAGNYVPADCRLINSYNLKIEESSLTGETVPVTKDAEVLLGEKTALGDTLNMAFANTIVVNGHGEAIVTDIGMNTKEMISLFDDNKIKDELLKFENDNILDKLYFIATDINDNEPWLLATDYMKNM